MSIPDPARYEQIARQASDLANRLQGLGSGILELGSRVDAVLGGTATGEDKKMLGLARGAADQLRHAVQNLHDATAAARKAAQEAQEGREAERKTTERKR